MSILTSKEQDVLIVMPGERLDTNAAPEAQKFIVEKINEGDVKIVIDFSKTQYIASSGLRVILKAAKEVKKKKGAIALCNANEQINEVLEISGFFSMFKYFSNLDEAVVSLQ
jgi:anti-sigma B factor antagonist